MISKSSRGSSSSSAPPHNSSTSPNTSRIHARSSLCPAISVSEYSKAVKSFCCASRIKLRPASRGVISGTAAPRCAGSCPCCRSIRARPSSLRSRAPSAIGSSTWIGSRRWCCARSRASMHDRRRSCASPTSERTCSIANPKSRPRRMKISRFLNLLSTNDPHCAQRFFKTSQFAKLQYTSQIANQSK